MSLRVAYVGNYRHPWCTEVHIADDLARLGVAVDRIQEEPSATTPQEVQQLRARLLADLPDLVLFTRTWGLHESATQLWRDLEAEGCQTASYHLDLYLGLPRGDTRLLRRDPFWTTGTVFTPDGDPNSAATFERLGVNHVWMPPAICSAELGLGTPRPDLYPHEIVFVGSERYHPEWAWRRELLAWLRATYGERFMRYGGDIPGGPIRGRRLADLYATARVVVGDSLALPGHTHYWSDRYPETIGRGGVLVAPHVPGIDDWHGGDFRPYEPGDFDSLRAHIDDVLTETWFAEDRWDLVSSCSARNTYQHRMTSMLDLLGLRELVVA